MALNCSCDILKCNMSNCSDVRAESPKYIESTFNVTVRLPYLSIQNGYAVWVANSITGFISYPIYVLGYVSNIYTCIYKREPRTRPRRTHRVSRGIAQLFLNLGTRRGCVVSITPRPPLPPGKTRYPLYRRLGEPRSRSGSVRKISSPPGF
jgi:hypothetical protein